MERHPAFPDCKYPPGILEVVSPIVDDAIAQSGPQDDSDDRMREKVAYILFCHVEPLGPTDPDKDGIGQQKGDHVHEPIPAYLQGAEINKDGINIRVFHYGFHIPKGAQTQLRTPEAVQ